MKKMKTTHTTHTPGPWQFTPRSEFVYTNEGNGTDGVICKMACSNTVLQWACDPESLENSANASLIASAPELLEALRDAENWLSNFGADSPDTGLKGLIISARAAIAKAEGTD